VNCGHHLIVEEKEHKVHPKERSKEQSVSFWMLSPEDMDSAQNTVLFFSI
jgi:Zn ribbon nucleic-acid-binding protein